MAEYINREAAINAIEAVPDGNWKNTRYVTEISAIPAADVAPVAHAHWEDVSVDDEGSMLIASMFCSNCKRWHNEVYHYGSPTEMAHYCPNCGAKMEDGK